MWLSANNAKIVKPIAGCISSLEGYPCFDKTDYSTINYVVCVIKKIATNDKPWDAIKKQNLGWFVNPEKEALLSALQNLFNSSENNLIRIGNKAKTYISKKYDLMSTSKQMKEEIISSFKNRK